MPRQRKAARRHVPSMLAQQSAEGCGRTQACRHLCCLPSVNSGDTLMYCVPTPMPTPQPRPPTTPHMPPALRPATPSGAPPKPQPAARQSFGEAYRHRYHSVLQKAWTLPWVVAQSRRAEQAGCPHRQQQAPVSAAALQPSSSAKKHCNAVLDMQPSCWICSHCVHQCKAPTYAETAAEPEAHPCAFPLELAHAHAAPRFCCRCVSAATVKAARVLEAGALWRRSLVFGQ